VAPALAHAEQLTRAAPLDSATAAACAGAEAVVEEVGASFEVEPCRGDGRDALEDHGEGFEKFVAGDTNKP